MMTSSHHTAVRTNSAKKPRSILARLARMIAVSHQRRHLMKLNDHDLADIGITRKEAIEESRLAAWNVPTHWRG